MEKIYQDLKKGISDDKEDVSVFNALFGRKYRRATWNSFIFCFINVFTGLCGIVFLSA